MIVAYLKSLFSHWKGGREQLHPTAPCWLSIENQSEVPTPEPALQDLSLALEGDGCMGCRGTHDGVQGRCARTGEMYSHPKVFPSCFNLPVVGVGAGSGEGLQEQIKRVVRRRNQARIDEQRAGQVLKYAPWKEESPKMPQSHRLGLNTSLETSTSLLKV